MAIMANYVKSAFYSPSLLSATFFLKINFFFIVIIYLCIDIIAEMHEIHNKKSENFNNIIIMITKAMDKQC